MSKGIIKWFNNEKGYGFIIGKSNEDIFVHYTSIKIDGFRTLNEGEEVKYQLIKTDKGLQAIDVIPVKQHEMSISF